MIMMMVRENTREFIIIFIYFLYKNFMFLNLYRYTKYLFYVSLFAFLTIIQDYSMNLKSIKVESIFGKRKIGMKIKPK